MWPLSVLLGREGKGEANKDILPDIPQVPEEEDADVKEKNGESENNFHEGTGDLAGMFGIDSELELVESMLL